MKKIGFIILFLSVISGTLVIASNSGWKDEYGNSVSEEQVFNTMENHFVNEAKNMAKQMLPIYQKLATCTPAKNEYFQIFGLNNNKCHFKYVDYDCYVPSDVYKKYSENAIKSSKDAMNGYISTESSETKYIDSILKNKTYCSYNMTLEIEYE